jgi:hypothetical protein
MARRRRFFPIHTFPMHTFPMHTFPMHTFPMHTFPMHTPSDWTFWLSVVLVVLAIISTFVFIPVISVNAFWVAVIGYVVLVIGCTIKTT